jgi:hypothetical protein
MFVNFYGLYKNVFHTNGDATISAIMVAHNHLSISITSVRVLYPGYHGLPITIQNSGYDQFLPTANGWGTIHPVPDMAPPLQVVKERPAT